MKPITLNSKAGVRVRYINGPMSRMIGRDGATTGHRFDGMIGVMFDAGHDRCAEQINVWPSSLVRLEKRDENSG